jgi:hypothetical protein
MITVSSRIEWAALSAINGFQQPVDVRSSGECCAVCCTEHVNERRRDVRRRVAHGDLHLPLGSPEELGEDALLEVVAESAARAHIGHHAHSVLGRLFAGHEVGDRRAR